MIVRKKIAKYPVRGQTKQVTSQHVHSPSAKGDASQVPGRAANKAASAAHGYEVHTYTDPSAMSMTYYLFVPDDYNPEQSYPLVLLLHGGGESANPKATPEQNSTLLLEQYYSQVWISSAIQEKWPAFILIPQVVAPGRWVNVPAVTGSYTLSAQPTYSLRMAKE
ncbi:MAG: hypothetical protein E6I32_19925, partial [Chloroflexi bacterium]